MHTLSLALHFTRRDLRNRFLGSFSGGLWALFQPLIQLLVYGFVFAYVFRQRVPGADAPGYLPFLAVAMWPWNAFSEAVQRSSLAITENAALIGKVALPREVLVFASVAATFALQAVGYLAVLLVLAFGGFGVHVAGLPLAFAGLALLFAFALGLAYLFAALQVFVRDLAPALVQIMMLWMFASPILYSAEMVPERWRGLFALNPFAVYAAHFRGVLLGQPLPSASEYLLAPLVAFAALAFGLGVFRRLARHFEDFL